MDIVKVMLSRPMVTGHVSHEKYKLTLAGPTRVSSREIVIWSRQLLQTGASESHQIV